MVVLVMEWSHEVIANQGQVSPSAVRCTLEAAVSVVVDAHRLAVLAALRRRCSAATERRRVHRLVGRPAPRLRRIVVVRRRPDRVASWDAHRPVELFHLETIAERNQPAVERALLGLSFLPGHLRAQQVKRSKAL